MGHTSYVLSIAITPDGKQALTSSYNGTYILWNLIVGKIIFTLEPANYGFSTNVASITPDGKQAFFGSEEGTCILLDLVTGKVIFTFIRHTLREWELPIRAVSITPDGKQALSGSLDGTCILWDLVARKTIFILKGHTSKVYSISITPDGKLAFSGFEDNTCILWDLVAGKAIFTLKGHTASVNKVSITPDGKRALSGSDDNTCILWDLVTGKAIFTLKGHTAKIYAIAITPDGNRAISHSEDNTCILWDLESGKALVRYVSNSNITTVSLSSTSILLGCSSGEVIFLDTYKELSYSDFVITSIRQIWDSEFKHYQPYVADCPLCGHRFAPPTEVLAAIAEITKKTGLTLEQSSCRELPDEVWKDPGLLSECPHCRGKLKFNPFIVGNEKDI